MPETQQQNFKKGHNSWIYLLHLELLKKIREIYQDLELFSPYGRDLGGTKHTDNIYVQIYPDSVVKTWALSLRHFINCQSCIEFFSRVSAKVLL